MAEPICTTDMWVRLLQWTTVLLSTRRALNDPFLSAWNDGLAKNFDPTLKAENLYDYLQVYSSIDHRSFAENVLYNPQAAAMGIRRQRTAATILCEFPERHVQIRANEITRRFGNGTLNKRHVHVWGEYIDIYSSIAGSVMLI